MYRQETENSFAGYACRSSKGSRSWWKYNAEDFKQQAKDWEKEANKVIAPNWYRLEATKIHFEFVEKYKHALSKS